MRIIFEEENVTGTNYVNSQDPGASRCINKMQVKLFLNRGSARKAAYDWSKI